MIREMFDATVDLLRSLRPRFKRVEPRVVTTRCAPGLFKFVYQATYFDRFGNSVPEFDGYANSAEEAAAETWAKVKAEEERIADVRVFYREDVDATEPSN